MTQDLRRIDPKPFMEGLDLSGAPGIGRLPVLSMIKVFDLRVDPSYQRDINRAGTANVRAIARNFSWKKFGVLIVAPLATGGYAIVDGQHRTFAAACRGIVEVPCLVIEADARQQAETFVALNSQITLMTPLQIHASRVSAGDPAALALVKVCAAGGVVICRYPIPGNRMSVGETLAVSVLYKMLQLHGPDLLAQALRCITRTGNGNPGMIRAALIKSLCSVLSDKAGFRRSEKRLLGAVGEIHLETEFDASTVEARRRKTSMEAVLSGRLLSQLDRNLRDLAA